MSRASLQTVPLETVALADAVDRVRELSLRLWAVRAAHPARRGLLGTRCATCGRSWPCPTVRATQPGSTPPTTTLPGPPQRPCGARHVP